MILSFVYARYVGITDIVIVLGFIIAIILGIKKGFVTKIINMANALCGLLFALAFSVKFANACLYPWFGDNIKQSVEANILKNETIQSIQTTGDISSVFEKLGLPRFLATIVTSNQTGEDLVNSVANSLAGFATTVVLVIIAFLILFFGTTLICFLLKLFVKLLRTSKFVRVVDGILGLVLYALLFYVLLQLIFFIIIIIYRNANMAGFNDYVLYDVLGQTSQLDGGTDAAFRISAWFFNKNFLANIITLLF